VGGLHCAFDGFIGACCDHTLLLGLLFFYYGIYLNREAVVSLRDRRTSQWKATTGADDYGLGK